MVGEFCLMRGVDEGCLLSFAEAPGNTILIKLDVDHRMMTIPAQMESLSSIADGEAIHLAGPDGLCAIERDGASVRFRFLGHDRRARGYEIEAVRFDAVVTILMAGRPNTIFASLS